MELNINSSVLLVGEANFSFTLSLLKFCESKYITTSCYESKNDLIKYNRDLIELNLNELSSKYNITPLYEIDACCLEKYFTNQKFDRIIFMFPHVSGRSNLKKNRLLMNRFFDSCKKVLLNENSSIFITLADGQGGTRFEKNPQKQTNRDSWTINEIAQKNGFILTQCYEFKPEHFEYYKSTGFRNQHKSFRTESGLIHKFQLSLLLEPFNLQLVDYHPIKELEYCLSEYFKADIKGNFIREGAKFCLDDFKDFCQISNFKYKIRINEELKDLNNYFSNYFDAGEYLKELFKLEDIRLLFSNDPRVIVECETDTHIGPIKLKHKIVPFSIDTLKWTHDLSFWYEENKFDLNEFIDVIRSTSDLIRYAKLIDSFSNLEKQAYCFRLVYESSDKALDWDTTTQIQYKLRYNLSTRLSGVITLR